MKTHRLSLSLLAIGALAPLAPAFDTLRPGFQISGSVALPALGSAYATLEDGRFFYFDGIDFQLRARDGSLLANLGSLGGFVFPSFAVLDPTESFALPGESSNGDIYRVDLGGSGYSLLTNLFFNYDAEFDLDPDYVWISAATGGFGQGNDVMRVELATGGSTHVAHVDGASGPLAVDAEGDLYYGDVVADFCPVPGTASVIVWDRALLLSGQMLDESDASLFADQFDAATSLEFDGTNGHLFLAETDFCSSVARVHEIDAEGERRTIVFESSNVVSNLELFAGAGGATFQPFQPKNAQLKLNLTDYGASSSHVVTIKPRRPTAAITGPGSGPGTMTLTIEGAQPDAAVFVLFGSVAHYQEDELVYDLGYGFPVFFALPANRIRRIPLAIPTDGTGTATFSYYDPGNLHGALVFQSIVLDAAAAPLGTSEAALN